MGFDRPLPLVAPRVTPSLDAAFHPAVLTNRAFNAELATRHHSETVEVALERSPSSISRFRTSIFAENDPKASWNFGYTERWLKFLLWSRGAHKIHYAGPRGLGRQLQEYYSQTPTGRFDAEIMGEKIYDKPFELQVKPREDLPAEQEHSQPLGRHWSGCRIGFDLGASDRKVAAVIDGNPVFTEEVVWDPRPQSDPQWHFDQIMDSLRRAARHLPKVDGIGGSSAGVYVDNQVKVASLFRGVPEALFRTRVKDLFIEIKRAWGGIPLEVVNDGEVTALAGAMSLNENGVLGIALGSSQAGGYVTPQGNITSWLNELAFVPVDYHPQAPRDEWSGDIGCGVQYFSQQAVGRLLPAAGIELSPAMPLPEKLVAVQQLMARGDERAARIYETIGTYLGYTVAQYLDFYDFKYLLVLGRVTTGQGGEIILARAREVLSEEFPDTAARISFHLPDEKEKRHGQAIAAASLPVV
jgi:predicted NBD/HSP70 family sugar kinase